MSEIDVSEEQAQVFPQSVVELSTDRRRAEQLRINALAQERRWYQEQLEVYSRAISTAARGAQWDTLDEFVAQAKLFRLVFAFLPDQSSDASTLEQRTNRFSKAMKTYNASEEWLRKWRLRSQMV